MILDYISLVTQENIENIVSKIEDKQQQKEFINIMLKIDVRISTEPIIVGKEFYYKIWILKKSTKNKVHLKLYFPITEIDEKTKSTFNLSEILKILRLIVDVPNDFEEYCEMHLREPSDPVCRNEYLHDLHIAEKFKKFLTQDEIRSISLCCSNDDDSEDDILDMQNEDILRSMCYSIIILNDEKEYDMLNDLKNSLEYYEDIIDSHGFSITNISEFIEELFPAMKDDRQLKNIIKDIGTYNKIVIEYKDYLKFLIKKYNITISGNIDKRVAFTLENNKIPNNRNKFIHVLLEYTFF